MDTDDLKSLDVPEHASDGSDHVHTEACGCTHDKYTPEEDEGTHGEDEQDCCTHHHEEEEDCYHHEEEDCCAHDHHHHDGADCDCCDESAQPPRQELNKDARGERRIYSIQNLSCAHCAALMEEKIRKLPGISDAVVVYATKQLRLAADDPEARLDQIRRVCMSVEPEVRIEPVDNIPRASETFHDDKAEMRSIGFGAALLVIGMILEHFQPFASMFIHCLAYVILGGDVLLTAFKNMKSGHIFDENFLMSLATLGAIAMGTYSEAVGVMLFYRIGEFFEHRAVEKSRRQIMEAVDLRPEVVHQIDANGVVHTIPAAQAKVGDLLLVRPGDRIPLDGIVRAGDSRVDTSPVTGEPVPVSVRPSSEVISGCINNTGALQVEVTNALADSMVTRILNAVENAAASKPRMDRFVTRFSRVYTPIVVVIAIITAIVPSIVTGDWMHWIYTALSFLVISCPCALVLSVPLSFFAGIGAGSKRGILFKGGASLEALKNVRTVAMDKTGTLTKGNFIVQRIFPAEGMNETALLSMAASCEQHSTHPIAHSILSAAHERGLQIVPPSKVQEIAGQGIVAMISGVTVLCGSRNLLETAGIDLSGHTVKTAGTEVLIAASGRFAGSIIISDTIKTNTKIAMKNLRKLDLITVMLTGDAQDSAESVAAQLDIQEVRARLMPEEKLNALRDIRAQHGAVMYVGDGINDAPVLAGADVGAAMGSGSDAAIEAADVVFMTSDPLAIGDSIEIARSSIRIAWQNIIFALVVKLGFMVLGLFGIASMWLAVFADTGVAMLCVLNAIRILYKN
ncbi:MAG: cadmium-translocating P-type ATPase [Butyricicoccus pullicaecorum]|nr:cadmium-translocating P-type ATPase [Butyricicoccus pullicaecorum]